jgi:glyoxylase-like metal-dependent hydrolase (beta-lactamase superfamily II)
VRACQELASRAHGMAYVEAVLWVVQSGLHEGRERQRPFLRHTRREPFGEWQVRFTGRWHATERFSRGRRPRNRQRRTLCHHGRVEMRVIRILAPNPGPLTLEGTNTWIVGEDPSLVVDPGPPDAEHVEEIRREAGRVGTILLTHRHPDHAPAAQMLADVTGAPVLAFWPEEGEERIEDGQLVRGGGVLLRALHTPGHAPDHIVLHEPLSGAMFTGDTVLGRGTSVIDPPEGNLGDYMDSLGRMLELRPGVLYPGHGPTVWHGEAKVREYIDHRNAREQQVLHGLGGGPRSPEELVPEIYGAYPVELHGVAARSLLAHFLKLEAEGRVRRECHGPDLRFGLVRVE